MARGDEERGSPGPQPPAADMRELRWDPEVARVAQRWADQCIFSHDDERGTRAFDAVGQNIFQSFRSADEGNAAMIDGAMKSWFEDEVENFDGDTVGKFA